MNDATTTPTSHTETANNQDFRALMLADYRLACMSREASLLGRKEVLGGKAKFGIFGDGKELAQIALAKFLRPGDWRSGYYRDQTLMMALDLLSVQQYFAALYADTDLAHEPTSGGRQMGGHFATRFLDEQGQWMSHLDQVNSSADISPTAGQMPRLLGLAQASKLYKQLPEAAAARPGFTDGGQEIAIGTIGDASTSEGPFWETMNAACVLQVPLLMNVWDDGYGISVPKQFQTTKSSISEALSGFEISDGTNGMLIYKVKGWDYPALVATYEEAIRRCREEQVPVLVHVEEVTQPQGHSTSGSHERYKSPERMAWAKEYDCLAQFGNFLILEGAATEEDLAAIGKEAKKAVRAEQKAAWAAFRQPVEAERDAVLALLDQTGPATAPIRAALAGAMDPGRSDIHRAAREALYATLREDGPARRALAQWLSAQQAVNRARYSSHLYSDCTDSALQVLPVPPVYPDEPELVDGRVVLQRNFREIFSRYPEVVTFGEDTGKIGGVNQAMEGMQAEFGDIRVSDTGIREATIAGQGIGLAMRGFRPIAEIQYLDYLYYCLQILRDDAATVRYRSAGGQKAPVIVRTRGHRLEGIWHSGSPMGAIINSLRGMHICVPRNMTQAAGMYNTLLAAEEPALVIECLNGYRSKEPLPTNLGDFRVPLGICEVVLPGTDITVVSYGSTLNIAMKAAEVLKSQFDISVELVDAQTLLPFDRTGVCQASVAKTNRLLVVDEDVPGGAAAYLLEAIVSGQSAFAHLDSRPETLTAQPHLPPYGTDGDYFSKPSREDIVERVLGIMNEADPNRFPALIP